MDLRTLFYFVTVAKEESITRAANSLHITQPTLSRQIKDLEEELGVKLFTRSNHHIHITEAGVLLKQRAQELLDMSQKLQDEFKYIDKQIEGNVYVGCGETIGIQIIAEIFKEIQQEYPNVYFHIYSGNAEDIEYRLDRGLLDFGILIQPANLNKYEALNLPSSDRWGLITQRNSKFAHYKQIERKVLSNEPLICSRQAIDQTIPNNEFLDWLGDSYDEANVVATFNLAFNAGLMVKANIGHAISLENLIDTSEENDLCFIPLYPVLEAKHNIVWRKDHTFSKAAQLFLDRATAVCKDN
ncbi:LysR family transcriptional regulator [Staphylococcus gallinarum]|jgi:DNA-binding transcriptional LysR family regulator|uniref:LysR family transcriptional regulator n=1 Tax=Staphylococcus gallinarum TaxID=1293 RepID=A0ABQ0Y569_STAGA|nr:LysR family transcriptional regulator [Staphylococcus gallinarum]KIR12599.1 LysR family transcriptional regulator [Staphylococcus gallinarum]MCD8820811.1 LysR family transcriptional regulator [Staphylococcus gallinarum]MCD8829164.1 LysR family transcriptional regulator [Staphylococcus gallinarum]MCD8844323.1 LysR family transcriptional regulator [Staphylococcus gallinarum]MCD8871409.1 LysR family transcriptional regulator [Staphylococcus gallinarum]